MENRCDICGSNDRVSAVPEDIFIRLDDLGYLKNLTKEYKEELELKMETDENVNRTIVLKNELSNLMTETSKLSTKMDEAKIKLLEKSLLLPSMRSQVMNIEGCLQNKRIDLEIQSAARDEINQNLKELGNLLKYLRLKKVLEVFSIFILKVDDSYNTCTHIQNEDTIKHGNEMKLDGISTILDLPLTNNGDYQHIPHEITASALSYITHLVDTLSVILNIPPTHPIMPFETYDCIISPQNDQRRVCLLTPVNRIQSSFVKDFARSGSYASQISNAYPHFNNATPSKSAKVSTKANKSSHGNGGKHVKSPPNPHMKSTASNDYPFEMNLNHDFSYALTLLQQNIITLCLRYGIPHTMLYPSQAMLLNLHVMKNFCIKKFLAMKTYMKNFISIHNISVLCSTLKNSKQDHLMNPTDLNHIPHLTYRYRRYRLSDQFNKTTDHDTYHASNQRSSSSSHNQGNKNRPGNESNITSKNPNLKLNQNLWNNKRNNSKSDDDEWSIIDMENMKSTTKLN